MEASGRKAHDTRCSETDTNSKSGLRLIFLSSVVCLLSSDICFFQFHIPRSEFNSSDLLTFPPSVCFHSSVICLLSTVLGERLVWGICTGWRVDDEIKNPKSDIQNPERSNCGRYRRQFGMLGLSGIFI